METYPQIHLSYWSLSFSPNPTTRVSPKVKKETGKKSPVCFSPSVVVLWCQASRPTPLLTHVNPSLWFEKDSFRYKNVEIQRKIPKKLISLILFPPWVRSWIWYNIRCESLIKCASLGKKKHAYVCLTFTTSPIPHLTTIQLKMSNEYVSEPDRKHEVTDVSYVALRLPLGMTQLLPLFLCKHTHTHTPLPYLCTIANAYGNQIMS